MPARFFSQERQDEFITRFVFANKRNGSFVDVGAHDGVTFSNTKYLEQELGWRGICVEPNPDAFKLLAANRKATCLNVCISSTCGEVVFSKVSGYGEMLSGISNNFDARHRERIRATLAEKGGGIEEIRVRSATLDSLVRQYHISAIDYLSIDTEGSELQILQTLDLNKCPVKLLSVENNYSSKDVPNHLCNVGYRLIHTLGADQLYMRRLTLSERVRVKWGISLFRLQWHISRRILGLSTA